MLGTRVTLDVDPDGGTTTYTLKVTDVFGLMSSTMVDVVVNDTVPPVAPAGPLVVDVDEAGSCEGTMPDLTGEISPTDACSPVTVTQDIPIGTPLAKAGDDKLNGR